MYLGERRTFNSTYLPPFKYGLLFLGFDTDMIHTWLDAHSKIPANLETVNRAGHLTDLLVAVGSVIGHSSCLVHVVVACQVVWKLAASDGEPIPMTMLRVDGNSGTIKVHAAWNTLTKGRQVPAFIVRRCRRAFYRNLLSSERLLARCRVRTAWFWECLK